MTWPDDMSGGDPWQPHGRPAPSAPEPLDEPRPPGAAYRPYDPDAPAPPPDAAGRNRLLSAAIVCTVIAAVGLLVAVGVAAFAAVTVSSSEVDGNGYVVVMAYVVGAPAAAVAVLAGVAAAVCWWRYRHPHW